MKRLLLLLLLLLLVPAARAELRVAQENGVPAITSRDTLAAFTPAPDELWVAAAQGPLLIDRTTVDEAGWKVEPLQVQGGVGVKITVKGAGAWRLKPMPWGWQVVQGAGQKLPPVRLNVVKMKDAIKVGDQAVLTARSADGRRYWLVPAAGPVPGGVDTLGGLAVPVGAALALPAVAPIAAPVSATVVPKAPTQAVPAKAEKALPKVPLFKARSLAAVATPTTVVENLKEQFLRVISPPQSQLAAQPPLLSVEGLRYIPGQMVPFSLPPEWAFQAGKVVPAEVVKRRAARAQAMGALEVALEQTRKASKDLPAEVEPAPVVSPTEAVAVSATQVAEAKPATLAWPKPAPNTDYLPAMQAWLMRIARGSDATKPRLREEFAMFNVAWGRGAEALMALNANGDTLGNRGQFVAALAQLQQSNPDAALQQLNGLAQKAGRGEWRDNLNLWRTVALSETGRYADALKAWPDDAEGMLAAYPARLRSLARFGYATALVNVGDTAAAREYTDRLALAYKPAQTKKASKDETPSPVAEGAPPRLNLLRGLARLNSRDEKDGLRILASVAEQKDDLKSAYEAKYAFVQALQRRGELAQPQYIRYLDELARFWRGDELEAKTLRELGKQYMVARDYRAALTAWRDLVRVAPTLPDMADLTDQMTAALVAAFDPESPAAYDPLEYLGMYYDFKELVPADPRGDRISERVAELLLQLGLPERAQPILEQLLKYRLAGSGANAADPAAQGRVALLLAQANREMGNAADSLETLDHWKAVMKTSFQQQQWQIAEARALTDLGKLDNAQKVLKDRHDASVQQVQADVAWQRQDWKTLAATLKPVVQNMNPAGVSGSLPLAVVKLAYAETENGNRQTLNQLQRKWANVGGDNTAAVFSTLQGTLGVTPSAVLAQQPLGQVAGSIAAAEQLTARIRDEHSQVQQVREETRQYDDKMRYMELLPPPRI